MVQLSDSVCRSERKLPAERERNKTEIFYHRKPRPAVVNHDVQQEVGTDDITGEIHNKNGEINDNMVEVEVDAQIKDTPGPGPGQTEDLEEEGGNVAVIEDTILMRPGNAAQHILVPVLPVLPPVPSLLPPVRPQLFYPLHPPHAPIRTFPLHFLYRHCFPFCKVGL